MTVTEKGIREMGWEAALLKDYYHGHSTAWAKLLADLPAYVAGLAAEGAQR